MRRRERRLPATSMASDSRFHSSMMVRHFSFWPLAQASNTKSYAHTWFGPVAGTGRGRLLQRGVGVVDAVIVGVRHATGDARDRYSSSNFALEKDANASIPVPRVLRSQSAHSFAHRSVLFGHLRLVLKRRACSLQKRARTSARQPATTGVLHLLSTLMRAHHFKPGRQPNGGGSGMASFAANSSRCAHRHAWPKSYEPSHVAPFVKGSPELETTAKRRASASLPTADRGKRRGMPGWP